MKIRLTRQYRFTVLATVAALGAFAPGLRAQWGSIRANNREAREHQAEHREPERGRHEPEHGRVAPQPAPRPVVEPQRHEDIEAERRRGLYWGGYHPGMTFKTLPRGYVQVSHGGIGYYYYDGVFLRPTPGGPYAVVVPPVGVMVPQLPDGVQLVVAPQGTYYYAGGAFYLPVPGGFQVVPAPLGATVNGLPPGATAIVINGKLYYLAGSTYYRPIMAGGVTVYVTARP